MKWYLQVLKKYVTFTGRARRREYWMFSLFNLVFYFASVVVDNVLGTTFPNLPFGIIYSIYSLAVFLPTLAVTIRRLHDVGKSGWMILIALFPIVGAIWLFVLMLLDGEQGENAYGKNPKDEQAEDIITDQKTKDTIIMIVVIWFLLMNVWFNYIRLIINIDSIMVYLYSRGIYFLLSGLIPIGLAFAVKNKSKRIVLFVIGAIYLLLHFITFITRWQIFVQ